MAAFEGVQWIHALFFYTMLDAAISVPP